MTPDPTSLSADGRTLRPSWRAWRRNRGRRMGAVVGFVIGTPVIMVPLLRADAGTLLVILAVVVPPTLILALGSLALSVRATRVTLLPGAIEVRTWRSRDRFELDGSFRAGEVGAPEIGRAHV